MFGRMIDVGPKFYSVPPQPMRVTYRSRILTFHVWSFVKVCKILHNTVVVVFQL